MIRLVVFFHGLYIDHNYVNRTMDFAHLEPASSANSTDTAGTTTTRATVRICICIIGSGHVWKQRTDHDPAPPISGSRGDCRSHHLDVVLYSAQILNFSSRL
jgi:hypothetical protein